VPIACASVTLCLVSLCRRVRIETAIRLAAEQLDKEKIAKERYMKEHDDAVAREQQDEAEAKQLHNKAVGLAQKAIEQRTTFHVQQDRAEMADKEIGLDKRIASLMAAKAESMKKQAEQSVRVAHEASTEAEHLKAKIRSLEKDALDKGEHASVMVRLSLSLPLSLPLPLSPSLSLSLSLCYVRQSAHIISNTHRN
jgi:hypothetical protein